MDRALGILGLAALLMLPTATAQSQSVILEWDAVTLDVTGQPESLSGYDVGYGIQPPGDYSNGFSVGPGELSAQIDHLQNGASYVFSVRAVDLANNESAWAVQVNYTVSYEICSNLIDDDADGLTDCFDPACPPDIEDGSDLCDGFDNDCDGDIDENLDAPACALQAGVCASATQPCGGAQGFLACSAADYGADYELQETRCDGLDNDCDGGTDQDLNAPACPLQLGVCAGSRQPCLGSAGWGACDYGLDYEAAVETRCDGLDNDCDGSIDEGLAGCCDEGDSVTCSSDEGECTLGEQVCDAAGNWSECSGVLPGAEACDGLDNDCDGETDEALDAPACPLSLGVCAGGRSSCQGAAGWSACDYGEYYEVDETLCDGLDNDCDGLTDEPAACSSPPDGGGEDGSAEDGGGEDGSSDQDQTTEEIVISGGCACSSAPTASLGFLSVVLLLAFRRRH